MKSQSFSVYHSFIQSFMQEKSFMWDITFSISKYVKVYYFFFFFKFVLNKAFFFWLEHDRCWCRSVETTTTNLDWEHKRIQILSFGFPNLIRYCEEQEKRIW